MNEKDSMQLALFRFGLISPLLPLSEEGKLKENIQAEVSRFSIVKILVASQLGDLGKI